MLYSDVLQSLKSSGIVSNGGLNEKSKNKFFSYDKAVALAEALEKNGLVIKWDRRRREKGYDDISRKSTRKEGRGDRRRT